MPYTYQDYLSGQTPPDGWDCADAADAGWTGREIIDALRREAKPFKLSDDPPPDDPPPPAEPEPPPPPRPRAVPQSIPREQTAPDTGTVVSLATRRSFSSDDGWQSQLICNEEGKLKPGLFNNWVTFLRHHPQLKGVFAWNEFSSRVMVISPPPWQRTGFTPHEIGDADIGETVSWLEHHFMTPKVSNVIPAIKQAAMTCAYDPLRDYLEGIVWDGQPRIETWLQAYLGCDDDEAGYASIVGRRFLISAVARALEPGAKVDTMLILEGKQGALKSTVFERLFGAPFFTDHMPDIENKDAMLQIQGVWGVEVAEMHRFTQAESNAVKKFLSSRIDRFRGPYERVTANYPRRTVIVGTINPDGTGYLKDPTGARRFWPVLCGRVDLPALERDRDQLWSEAVTLYRAGQPWWVQPYEEEAVAIEQQARTEVDAWYTYIEDNVRGETSVSLNRVVSALHIPPERLDTKHMARIGRIMKMLGFERQRSAGRDGWRKMG